MVRRNIYIHEVDLKSISVPNADRKQFAQKLKYGWEQKLK